MRNIEFDHEAAKAELIGFASTEDPARDRWTELKVWYLHTPPHHGRPWLSEVFGCSRVEGETPRIQRLNVGSLERALKLFADSDIGVVASEEARDWEEQVQKKLKINSNEDNFHLMLRSGDRGPRGALSLNHDGNAVPDEDPGALEWLYGQPDGGKATFASMLAKDFDLAPRTVTTALSSNTPIRIPLRAALPFFDIARFRAWRKREKGDWIYPSAPAPLWPTKDTELSDLPFKAMTVASLEDAGYKNAGDLLARRRGLMPSAWANAILRLPNIGRKAFGRINSMLDDLEKGDE